MKIGYIREIDNGTKDFDYWVEELTKAGCERIYKDRGDTYRERPALDSVLKNLQAGDVLIVPSLDCIARSTPHLFEVMFRLDEAKVEFISLLEALKPFGSDWIYFYRFCRNCAEMERRLLGERTAIGLRAAKSSGKRGGRKPVLNEEKQKAVREMLDAAKAAGNDPEFSIIARIVSVSERTVRRFANGQYVNAAK